jgi:acyl-CoA reductase-like NAD-dependent aldehyde dehydrogenase
MFNRIAVLHLLLSRQANCKRGAPHGLSVCLWLNVVKNYVEQARVVLKWTPETQIPASGHLGPRRIPAQRSRLSPWNFPYQLAFGPVIDILGAGNRALLKPSELTSVMKRLVARYFDEAELAVVTGGPDIGAAFTGLAFDHLIFTGSTAVGRHVARAAADNLTPLTLELGGKSPVIVSKTANLSMAAERIMTTKT